MISSKEILQKTGLKTAKTLTRWYKRGIIPEPLIRTHPSGRGKMAYWPDWVLERCVRIAELQKQGHSLRSAVQLIGLERVKRITKEVMEGPLISDILKSKKIKLKNDREISLHDLFLALIMGEVERIVSDPGLHSILISNMREQEAFELALRFFESGYNPVLLFDGVDSQITPDFMVGHRLSSNVAGQRPYLLVPLLPLIRKFFSGLGKELPGEPNAFPPQKIWAKQGDAIVEYEYFLGGPKGFELIRETAKAIGSAPEEPQRSDEANKVLGKPSK